MLLDWNGGAPGLGSPWVFAHCLVLSASRPGNCAPPGNEVELGGADLSGGAMSKAGDDFPTVEPQNVTLDPMESVSMETLQFDYAGGPLPLDSAPPTVGLFDYNSQQPVQNCSYL